MIPFELWRTTVAFGAAFLAGVVNSVAGGGTLLSFPTLIWLGLDSITANATSTVAIWPGSVGGMWGYRRELSGTDARYRLLVIPSIIGGLGGAVLLRYTPPSTFDHIVPYLILFATFLFMAQGTVQRLLKTSEAANRHSSRWLVGALLFQVLVGVYGGYFGAGIGIMMLAALSILGLSDIHEMNSLKVVLGGVINGIAAAYFVWARMVHWPDVLVMGIGSIVGGYGGAGLARKVGRTAVRRIVVLVGFAMAVSLFIRR